MSFDREASLRRIKPQRRTAAIIRRPDDHLPWVAAPGPGAELLLDTCVYLDVLRGKTPGQVDDLLSLRIVNHSTIALGELTHLYGRMDPSHPDTRRTLQAISAVIDDIPIHRLTAPSARAFGEAGMLAGLTARLGGRAAGVALLNDALLYLHAREMGYEVLTGNIGDFDLFDQVLPGSSVRLYRAV